MKKKLYYVILIIVCICALLGGLGLSIKFKKPNSNTTSTDKTELSTPTDGEYAINETEKVSITKTGSNELVNNVDIIGVYKNKEVDSLFTPTEQIQIHAKNNNNVSTEVLFEFDYLNEEGKIVDYDTKRLLVFPNRDFGIVFNLQDKEKLKYETYKITYYTKRKTAGYITFENITPEDYSVVRTPTGNIEITFINDNDKDINRMTFSCFFYKNGKEIAVATAFASGNLNGILKGDGANATVYVSTYKYDYDDYKVVLSEATNYKEESESWYGDNYE